MLVLGVNVGSLSDSFSCTVTLLPTLHRTPRSQLALKPQKVQSCLYRAVSGIRCKADTVFGVDHAQALAESHIGESWGSHVGTGKLRPAWS
jgi:hypothetical protein